MNKLYGLCIGLVLCVLGACVNKPEGYIIRGTEEGTVD